jgi:hypothetical protein
MDPPSTTERRKRPTRERQPQLSATMSTPSVVVALGERQSDCKITVASLCCDSVQAKSTSSEPTGQRHLHESETRSSPDMVPIWAQDHHHAKRLDATVDRPCSLVAHSSGFHGSGLATQLSRVSRPDTSNCSAKIPHHFDNNGGVTVSLPPTLSTTPGSSKAVYKYWGADPRIQTTDQPTSTQSPRQAPRPQRLPYTEEQKFSIIYHRIIKELSWPEIKDKCTSFFGSRSEDGLTSVYYRIRGSWNMGDVLKSNSNSVGERSKVEARANYFSRDFLDKLGYFE